MLVSFGFKQTIFEPTRGNACLDNVFINFDISDLVAQNTELNISDHAAQIVHFTCMSNVKIVTKQSKICRPITQVGLYKFYDIVEKSSFSFIDSNKFNTNTKFCMFIKILETANLEAFPEKTYYVRSDQTNNITWFNSELRHMREQLQLLGNLKRKFKTTYLEHAYRQYKDRYKKTIYKNKKDANESYIKSSDNLQKATWSLISSFKSSGKKQVNESTINPDVFNEFFCNVGHELTKNVPSSNFNP